MAGWLVKSDPDEYSAADLERDGTTLWDGVRNPAAQQHMRAMKAGDPLLLYHTGNEKAVVATGKVAAAPQPDSGDPGGKAVAVRLAFDAWLEHPVPLAAIRNEPSLAEFDLVRISRLSVMPVSSAHWKIILRLAEQGAADRGSTCRRTARAKAGRTKAARTKAARTKAARTKSGRS